MTLTPAESKIHEGVLIMQLAVHKTAVDHGWWEDGADGKSFGEKVALMHSELSEALECHRDGEPDLWYKTADGQKGDDPIGRDGVPNKPEGAASEFADAIIRIADFCQHEDIPLAEALIHKMRYNDTRPYRHGGKKI